MAFTTQNQSLMFYTFQTGTRDTGGYSSSSTRDSCTAYSRQVQEIQEDIPVAVPEIVIQHIPDRYKRIFHPLQKLVQYSSNTRDSCFS
jgi:hypothetical protein